MMFVVVASSICLAYASAVLRVEDRFADKLRRLQDVGGTAYELHSPISAEELRFIDFCIFREFPISGIAFSSGPLDRNRWTLVSEFQEIKGLTIENADGLFSSRPVTSATQDLQAISLFDCQVHENDLEELGRWQSLRHVILVNGELTASSARTLSHLRQVTRLHVCKSPIREKDAQQIWNLGAICELRLQSCGLTDEHMIGISALGSLETLDLSGNHLSSAALNEIARIPRLKSLSLVGVALSANDLDAIGRCQRLRNLRISNDCVGAEIVKNFIEQHPEVMVFRE